MEVLSDLELESDHEYDAGPLHFLEEDDDVLEDQLSGDDLLILKEVDEMYADTPPPELDKISAELSEEVFVLGNALCDIKLIPLKKKHYCFRAFMRYYSNAVLIVHPAIMKRKKKWSKF
ncbi:hypothetical protein SARC_05067 [Sphaeroforma arctica JP610]|uniref:Uncharacterized protein n=1 Tax=Sphaeroforma arctica JP610 TaxID=667725 RepID=A0A0L0G1G5_9EUKA|nr:hypothetical protein SARC_05067 [Sphaeroforma arctica JP610]KNC82646.1 hypothetical protein SARC_05067 [Sphaeroforma arctica JP610]|eukprot:XP_014156548.1 hypothetical protein SARC_05067 [Sphaeroforma arctica JP610]